MFDTQLASRRFHSFVILCAYYILFFAASSFHFFNERRMLTAVKPVGCGPCRGGASVLAFSSRLRIEYRNKASINIWKHKQSIVIDDHTSSLSGYRSVKVSFGFVSDSDDGVLCMWRPLWQVTIWVRMFHAKQRFRDKCSNRMISSAISGGVVLLF